MSAPRADNEYGIGYRDGRPCLYAADEGGYGYYVAAGTICEQPYQGYAWEATAEPQYAGLRIEIAVYSEDLFSDSTGSDVEASGERFGGLLEQRIQAEYPEADVRVHVQHHITGPSPITINGAPS